MLPGRFEQKDDLLTLLWLNLVKPRIKSRRFVIDALYMAMTGLRGTGSLRLRVAPPNGGETKLYENAGLVPPVFMWDILEQSRARLHPWDHSAGLHNNANFHLANYWSVVTSISVQCQDASGSGSGAGEGSGEHKPHDDLSIRTYPLPPVEPKSMVSVYLQLVC